MNRIAGRSWIVVFLTVLLLGGFGFFLFEYFTQAGEWSVSAGSPHVYNGSNLDCGTVTDADGVVLLQMEQDRLYSIDSRLRMATVHWLGDRYGNINAPALSNYAEQIAGYDLFNGVYSYSDTGGITQLTISSDIQLAALDAMGDYKGTVAVYNYKTGQILCAVTTPTYDPDNVPRIDEDTTGIYDGLYVNRFTQSTYIPGSVFKVVTLAAALETIPDIEQQQFTCNGSYQIGDNVITCERTHYTQNLKTAFGNSCNCAFAQIAQQLGAETLDRYVRQYQVTESVTFDGITTAHGNFEAVDAAEVDVAWSAIGQYNDLINPCSFLTFIGAIANEGVGVMPYIVENITVGESSTYQAQTQTGDRIMSANTAKTLAEYMESNVSNYYGTWNFPDMTVCAKTGTAEVGGDKKPNAMLVGFVQDEKYPLAFIVCVEDAGYGGTVCIPIISKVLSECKNALDP